MIDPKPRFRRKRLEPTSRDLQKAQTVGRLLDAARELFSAHGFDAVTVQDIAERAGGVSPTLIGAHFGSKAGLLFSIVAANNAGQVDRARQEAAKARSALGKLQKVVGVWCAMDLRDPKLLAAMQAMSWTWTEEAEEANAAERAAAEDLLADIVREGQQRGELRPIVPATAARIIFAIFTWGLRAAVFEGRSAEQCTATIGAQVRALLVDDGPAG